MEIRRFAILLIGSAAIGCSASARPRGAPFAGASLLAPLSDQEEAHDALLSADVSRADSVARLGYAEGLTGMLAGDIIYLRGGLPIVRGIKAAHAVIAAESIAVAAPVRWQPVRAAVSADGKNGFSYGYTIVGTAPTASAASAGDPGRATLRVDRYIAWWRREPRGWRIAAYAETYGAPPAPMSLPAGAADAVVPDSPMARSRGALEAVREADTDFAREAARQGTGAAFGMYAADDAQVFSSAGEFISGPEAIRQSFGAGSTGELAWRPVAGEVAQSGDVGFTVGNAVFTGERADGSPTTRYSKYLTVWKKQHDGNWRYVVDGGSARPND